MQKQKKALCQSCHDSYGDEEYCFGRCCGRAMVEIPQEVWDKISHDRDSVNQAIKSFGVKITTE